MIKILSLNLVKNSLNNNKILNPSNYPILYYWDGNNQVINEILNNKEFSQYINDKIINLDNYSFTKLYIIDYDLDSENYNQQIVDIQELYSLSINNYNDLAYQYLYNIFKKLYNISIKKEYKPTDNDTYIDDIIEIYTLLKNKFKERISVETLKQYIISQLQQEYKLNKNNIDYIINLYKDIIN